MSEETLQFYTDRWYFLINCDGMLVGAICLQEVTQLVAGYRTKKPSSSYVAFFQRDPWEEKESAGVIYQKKDLAALIAGVMNEHDIRRTMVADQMEISELREKLWFIFLNKYLNPHVGCHTSLRARDLICSGTSNIMKQLAAFYFVTYKEGFLSELEKWETGYNAWFQA